MTIGTQQQPNPTPGGVSVTDLVLADLQARREMGRKQYGRELETGNGRDALVDAYHEALDLALYLRQEIEERGARG